MVWVIAFGELFFGDLWCVVWGYGGMRTHFSLLNPQLRQLHNPGSSSKTDSPKDCGLHKRMWAANVKLCEFMTLPGHFSGHF